MISEFVDIFRQIGQFLKGLDKENKMTLISLKGLLSFGTCLVIYMVQ